MDDESVQNLLREATLLSTQYRRSLASLHREASIPASGWQLMQALAAQGPMTVPQIARQRSSFRQNIQTLVNALAIDGLVEFASNPAHLRSHLVCITDKGRASLAAETNKESSVLAGLAQRLDEVQVVSATMLLSQVRELLVGQGTIRQAPKPKPQPFQKFAPSNSVPEDNELPFNLL